MVQKVNGRGHRQLTVRVPLADHQRFKVWAAKKGVTLSSFLEAAAVATTWTMPPVRKPKPPFKMMTLYVRPESHSMIKRRCAALRITMGDFLLAAGRSALR